MGGCVLVVEDDEGVRQALGLALEPAYGLRMAATAEEALANGTAADDDVRVIFLDGNLGPGLSGEQALPLLRRRFPHARIVFTGALGSLRAQALIQAGASEVLPKPWSLKDLLGAARAGFSEA